VTGHVEQHDPFIGSLTDGGSLARFIELTDVDGSASQLCLHARVAREVDSEAGEDVVEKTRTVPPALVATPAIGVVERTQGKVEDLLSREWQRAEVQVGVSRIS
jgi:hypothetical protein